MTNDDEHYEFVIDTNEYAGNFERQMCAYVTGCIGDCGVGDDIADIVRDDIAQSGFSEPIDDLVISLPDEHGCHRPVTSGPTPGFINDGMGNHYTKEEWEAKNEKNGYPACQSVEIHLDDIPEDDLVDFFIERARAFATSKHAEEATGFKIEILGFRLVRRYQMRETIWRRGGSRE